MIDIEERKKYNKIYGNIGEEIASNYLQKKGYKIIEKNYKISLGEIDLICLDIVNSQKVYVFVEVKYRNSKKFGLPREAITLYKQKNIKKVAKYYLKVNKLYDKVPVRFDCVEIVGNDCIDSKNDKFEINLIKNIF